MGNLEFDLDDGEIRFKTSVDLQGVEVTAALLHRLIEANVTVFKRYESGGVMAMIEGMAPKDALASVEG